MKFNSLHTVIVSCALALGFTVTACDDDGGGSKDVCEQAADVFNDCDIPSSDGGDESGGEAAACEGAIEAAAQCAVDFPDEVCAALTAPAELEGYADYAACLAG